MTRIAVPLPQSAATRPTASGGTAWTALPGGRGARHLAEPLPPAQLQNILADLARSQPRHRTQPLPVHKLEFPKLPAALTVAAIVAARDEAATLPLVVHQLQRLPLLELIVVANGCVDGTAEAARSAGCRVIEYREPLGHDVGRALGAAQTQAEICLFADADIVLGAEYFMPFLLATAQGVDIALNDPRPFIPVPDAVSTAKEFLNTALGRKDLGYASMTSVPHALRRSAIQRIGLDRLAVPPLAQAVGVLEGLLVRAVANVDVISTNRVHPLDSQPRSPRLLEETILGDHLEALQYVLRRQGARGGFSDAGRRRDLLTRPDP